MSMTIRSLSKFFVGSLSASLFLATAAMADVKDDVADASKHVASARNVLTDLVIDSEESELDALLGSRTIVHLSEDASDISSELSKSNFRLGRTEDAFVAFARTYRDAVRRYDEELADRCFDGPFVVKVGDSLDAAGESVWIASRALGLRVKLPHPARLADVCGEIDGK